MLKENENDIERYINFVNEYLLIMKSNTDVMNKDDIQLSDLKKVTGSRLTVLNILQSENQRYKAMAKLIEEEFKIWWSTEYSISRKELNPKTLAGNKYASKSEIEAETIARNKDKYLELKRQVIDIQNKREFISRLIEDWRSVQFDVQNDIKILEIESRFYGADSYLNKTANQIEENLNKVSRRQRPESE